MDKLTWDFLQICNRNKDGSYSTRAARIKVLKQSAKELKSMGFNQLRATQLKPKHIEKLLDHWQSKQLATGTVKNRMAHMRWWAEKVGKQNIIPKDNAKLGIENRRYVTNEDKSLRNVQQQINRIQDKHAKLSLQLQKEFGLRREEAIKFRASIADQGNKIKLKHSWCKGGRERELPVVTEKQRVLINKVREFTGAGSLIPPDKRYIDQLRVFERETIKVGISHTHGLRHAYAQDRYLELTKFNAPAAGGKTSRSLDPCEKVLDAMARAKLTHELGHTRPEITSVYLGR